jgi:hypothetical protein
MVCGDNIRPERAFVTQAFDGTWPQPEGAAIWQHFLVHGPSRELSRPPDDFLRIADTALAIERR